ncbi:transposase [Rhodospirillum sp. A1_3_36]|uniref:transposase n=1 Tax=Rhodospirillum sp. A1_3_36 TaxID=3391666 RepID=UPI0039A615E2
MTRRPTLHDRAHFSVAVDGEIDSPLGGKTAHRSIRARLPERQGHPALDLHFSAKRIRGSEGIIIIASTEPGLGPLKLYRKRWAIECLFGDTKTRGLNLEDTRLTISSRLSLLMAIVTLAIAWACRTASDIMVRAAPPRKAHGYYAKSWFRVGLDELRRRMRTNHNTATAPLIKALKSRRVV